jgi:hypothetical protein
MTYTSSNQQQHANTAPHSKNAALRSESPLPAAHYAARQPHAATHQAGRGLSCFSSLKRARAKP